MAGLFAPTCATFVDFSTNSSVKQTSTDDWEKEENDNPCVVAEP